MTHHELWPLRRRAGGGGFAAGPQRIVIQLPGFQLWDFPLHDIQTEGSDLWIDGTGGGGLAAGLQRVVAQLPRLRFRSLPPHEVQRNSSERHIGRTTAIVRCAAKARII